MRFTTEHSQHTWSLSPAPHPSLGSLQTLPPSLTAVEHPDSVAEHLVGKHSPDYDHEAFLGKTEAERFDQLPPEEAKRRLG